MTKHWLSDEEYAKAHTRLRMQIYGVFDNFKMHGLQIYIDGAVEECMRLAEDFSLVTRGENKPISLELIRKKKRGEKK